LYLDVLVFRSFLEELVIDDDIPVHPRLS